MSRPWSPRVGSEPVFPPRGSVNLKRHQREWSECDFLDPGLQKPSINRAREASYLRFTFLFYYKVNLLPALQAPKMKKVLPHRWRICNIRVIPCVLASVLPYKADSGDLSCEIHTQPFAKGGRQSSCGDPPSFHMLSLTLPTERRCPSPPFMLTLIRRGPPAARA